MFLVLTREQFSIFQVGNKFADKEKLTNSSRIISFAKCREDWNCLKGFDSFWVIFLADLWWLLCRKIDFNRMWWHIMPPWMPAQKDRLLTCPYDIYCASLRRINKCWEERVSVCLVWLEYPSDPQTIYFPAEKVVTMFTGTGLSLQRLVSLNHFVTCWKIPDGPTMPNMLQAIFESFHNSELFLIAAGALCFERTAVESDDHALWWVDKPEERTWWNEFCNVHNCKW